MISYFQQFGAKLTDDDRNRFSQSPQWNGKIFENSSPTSINISLKDLPSLLRKQFFEKAGRQPRNPIPIQKFDKDAFLTDSDSCSAVWFGHSVILIRIQGKTILCDPMFGPDTAPIAPFPSKRYSEDTLAIIDQLPPIDLVLLTHDHYDHLDLASIKKIHPKVRQFYVALGTARHLKKWGVDASIIKEFDWWQEAEFEGIEITFTPTRHFSGRGLFDRASSLWGGWAIKSQTEAIYISGDSGYNSHFKEVGERLGPFDFGFMECGQYNELWHAIHMFPEESIKAALDAKVKKVMPIHWAGFTLSIHTWTDPVERFTAEATKLKMPYSTPKIGELFQPSSINKHVERWWENPKFND